MFIPPAVAGDTLYVGSCSGSFYALDRHDGSLLWSYDTSLDGEPANFHGRIRIDGEVVVVGTDSGGEGHLYAFDPDTGEPRWKQAAPGGFPADVAGRGGRAFAVAMSGEVRSVDVASGRVLWARGGAEDARLLRSSAVVHEKRLLVALPGGQVSALAAESGEPVWEARVEGRLNTTLAVVDDSVYVGDLDGRIHRLALADGKPLGQYAGDPPAYGALQRGGVCLLALWGEKTLACLDPSLERVRWSRTTDMTWSSFRPLVRGGLVVVGTNAGEITAFELSRGIPVWKRQVEGEIKGLAAAGNVLYVGTLQGRVYAVRVTGFER